MRKSIKSQGDTFMAYIIFEVKTEDAAKINQLMKDDLVSRQSLLTRDGPSIGVDSDNLFVKIEGSEDGLKRAEELGTEMGFSKLEESKAAEVDQKIKEQEESAADGMGMIFG